MRSYAAAEKSVEPTALRTLTGTSPPAAGHVPKAPEFTTLIVIEPEPALIFRAPFFIVASP